MQQISEGDNLNRDVKVSVLSHLVISLDVRSFAWSDAKHKGVGPLKASDSAGSPGSAVSCSLISEGLCGAPGSVRGPLGAAGCCLVTL